jgi:VIT1/CCC1 family predicted Fe2+/Mn2+ transporter
MDRIQYDKSAFYAGNAFIFGVIAAVLFDFYGFTALCAFFVVLVVINLYLFGQENYRAE